MASSTTKGPWLHPSRRGANRITAPDGFVAASEAANGAEEALPAAILRNTITYAFIINPSTTASFVLSASRGLVVRAHCLAVRLLPQHDEQLKPRDRLNKTQQSNSAGDLSEGYTTIK